MFRVTGLSRKLAFLATHLRQVLRFYAVTFVSSVAMLFVSALATLIKDRIPQPSIAWEVAYYVLQYGPLLVLICLVCATAIDLFVRRLSGTGLVNKRIYVDAYYYSRGNYILLQRIVCENESAQPVRDILEVRDAYHERPIKVQASCGQLPGYTTHAISLVGPPLIHTQQHVAAQVNVEVQKYEWHAVIAPPLAAREEFGYFVRISAQGVERRAFEEGGTVFSWLVMTRTDEIIITIHAPCSYLAEILDFSVNDESGQIVASETRSVARPRLLAGGVALLWRILLPRPQLRYAVRYVFNQLGE